VIEALLSWFERAKRPFPWRAQGETDDPYRVLVAEALLHQTQATRAGPFYERFLARFPSLAALAAADDDSVLAAWQGLGYYQRALRLRSTAQLVATSYAGALPRQPEVLLTLPGVGRYTARAVAARAFGATLIAVDANVRRVGARVMAEPRPRDEEVEHALAQLLFGDARSSDARHANATEALIELGATVCRPRGPNCTACPLRPGCRAAQLGEPEAFPLALRRTEPRSEHVTLLVARHGDHVALRRRPRKGRWARLWGFPTDAAADAQEAPLVHFEHHLTHRRLAVRAIAAPPPGNDGATVWLELERVAAGGGDHPVAVIDQRLARALIDLERDAPGDQASAASAKRGERA